MGYFTGVTDPAESLDVNLPHEILGLSSCTLWILFICSIKNDRNLWVLAPRESSLSAVSRMIETYSFRLVWMGRGADEEQEQYLWQARKLSFSQVGFSNVSMVETVGPTLLISK